MKKESFHTEETKKKMSESHKGKHHSKETIEKMSKGLMGNINGLGKYREKSNSWKGGFVNGGGGYISFKAPEGCRFSCMKNNDGYIYLHRLVMAEYLNRPLDNKEVIHHKNEIRNDNRIENLELFENVTEHFTYHKKIKEGGKF